jgi:phytoene dehydrogenase-like protein
MAAGGNLMEDRSIVIIGGGVAGLATGCYAQMNGYRTHIVEKEPRPGGVCTSWRRKDYTFDGCIQWLMGSRSGSWLNQTWQELGALTGREVIDHDDFMRVEGRDGQTLVVYTDADRLEAHLRELAPSDAATSNQLCDAIRRTATLYQAEGRTWQGTAGALAPALPTLVPLLGTTWQGFAARYTDRFVRDALRSVFDFPDAPMLLGVAMLASMHARDAGHAIGGSLAFAQAIEQRYRELGGTITYDARIERIMIQDNRAVGVRLADGQVLEADRIISAADGHSTIFDLLGGRYVDRRIRQQYATQPLFAPLVLVSVGAALDLSDQPHALRFPLRTPARIAGATRDYLMARHYCFDPTMAPPGKSVVEVELETDYDLWSNLSRDPDRYEAEKRAIAEAVVAALDERFPGLAAVVEVTDVATPMTWVRHTANWRASFEGWLPTRGAMAGMLRGVRNTLPGLTHFYMVGQWVGGGGLPAVAMAGRGLIKSLCEQDGRPFVTTRAARPPAHLLPDFGTGAHEPTLPVAGAPAIPTEDEATHTRQVA